MVRIVGGVLKRTRLPVGNSPGLRPTPDRVRETAFNWLGDRVVDARCLDLFAGSGALGIEAASRGAAHVVLNEVDRRTATRLRQCIERFRSSTDPATRQVGQLMHLSTLDAARLLASTPHGQRFDLVFLDPPFDSDWLGRLWPTLPAVLAPDATVYVESDHALGGPLAGGLQITRHGRAGGVHYHLLQAVDPA